MAAQVSGGIYPVTNSDPEVVRPLPFTNVTNGSAKASGFEVKLPKAVGAQKGTLGFRPEAVTDRTTDGGTTLDMKVDVVERLGSDQYLYGSVGGDQLTARIDPRIAVTPGDRIKLGLDTRSLHFFDAESEQSLL